jgi:hydroxymethylbilane synthase
VTIIRIGTRGSELARRQTGIVLEALQSSCPQLQFEIIVIRTEGDLHPDRAIGEGWPIGSFTSAIERALLNRSIDVAVHSLKDLPTTDVPGLQIAAVPPRDSPHDVLITSRPLELNRLPAGIRIGTSSPRRAAQLRQLGDIDVVPIRGNVTTRLDKIGRDGLDGVVLAAAGLRRLGLAPQHALELPLHQFLPAPGQGALAVQVRSEDHSLISAVAAINHSPTAAAVDAERSFLQHVGAGCHTPVAALATVIDSTINLRGQLFSDDGCSMAAGELSGTEPRDLGRRLASTLRSQLDGSS